MPEPDLEVLRHSMQSSKVALGYANHLRDYFFSRGKYGAACVECACKLPAASHTACRLHDSSCEVKPHVIMRTDAELRNSSR